MHLLTPRLLLREFLPTDYDALHEIKSEAEAVRFEHAPFSPERTREYLQMAMQDGETDPRIHYRLALTIPPEDTLRGWIALTLNNPRIHEWEMGWTVHPKEWGKGYATEAARAVMHFAFTELGAHRIVAFCHAKNLPSTRVMEKLGMQREGHLRRVRWLNDAWCDELLFAILEQEFKK